MRALSVHDFGLAPQIAEGPPAQPLLRTPPLRLRRTTKISSSLSRFFMAVGSLTVAPRKSSRPKETNEGKLVLYAGPGVRHLIHAAHLLRVQQPANPAPAIRGGTGRGGCPEAG